MAEVKNEIERTIGETSGDVTYLITEKHTIADIARWIVKEDYTAEILMFLQDQSHL